jgi:3-(3-hydroxy-phenyl)propionate hydroxylase
VGVEVDTPDGPYRLRCEYLVAADGVRSTVRRALGLDFKGRVFEDRFLISDVRMQAAFPSERRFWFDPTFHAGRSALLHRQADDTWRIDLQLGPDADPEHDLPPENVASRLRSMLGPDVAFEIVWTSLYTFQCRRLERFGHGRVFFAGDAAHQVSPFGARGGNGGVQDADNLGWKLALVLKGTAPDRLLDSYDAERIPAADENILHSTRATDFMTPKTAASAAFRDAAPDTDAFTPLQRPGSPAVDAPIVRPDGTKGWLLRELQEGFTALCFGDAAAANVKDRRVPIAVKRVGAGGLGDPSGKAAERYDATPGTTYLIRPDQHVVGRWRRATAAQISAALDRTLALQE